MQQSSSRVAKHSRVGHPPTVQSAAFAAAAAAAPPEASAAAAAAAFILGRFIAGYAQVVDSFLFWGAVTALLLVYWEVSTAEVQSNLK
jgi:hypothetical protein